MEQLRWDYRRLLQMHRAVFLTEPLEEVASRLFPLRQQKEWIMTEEFCNYPNEAKATIEAWVTLLMAYRPVLPLKQVRQDIGNIFDLPSAKRKTSSTGKGHAERLEQYKEHAADQLDQDLKVLLGLTLVMLGPSQERPGVLEDARRDIYQLLGECSVAWALVLLGRTKELVLGYLVMAELSAFKAIKKQVTEAEMAFTRAQAALLAAESLG